MASDRPSDPGLALRDAVLNGLRTTPFKAYDEVPANAPTQYFSMGPLQVIPDEDDYDAADDLPRSRGSETFLQVDAWSRDLSHGETAAMCAQARDALRGALVVSGHTVIVHELQDTLLLKDLDGQTSHGIMKFRFLTEPA